MTDALDVSEPSPRYRARRAYHNGSVSVNLTHAKVARPAKIATPKPAAAVAPPIAKPSISRAPVVGRVLESYEAIVEAFRDRADDLEISRIELGRLAGLADGHVSMLLMKKSPMKHLGPVSLPAILQVLGLRFRIEEDIEQTALTVRRRQRRVSTHAHYGPQFSPISGRIKGRLFGYFAPTAAK